MASCLVCRRSSCLATTRATLPQVLSLRQSRSPRRGHKTSRRALNVFLSCFPTSQTSNERPDLFRTFALLLQQNTCSLNILRHGLPQQVRLIAHHQRPQPHPPIPAVRFRCCRPWHRKCLSPRHVCGMLGIARATGCNDRLTDHSMQKPNPTPPGGRACTMGPWSVHRGDRKDLSR